MHGDTFIKITCSAYYKVTLIDALLLNNRLQIPVAPQPLYLGTRIPVNNITLIVLETPGHNNEDISFPDPDLLFYFTFDTAHPGDTIKAPYADMICAHHQFSARKNFAIPLVWNANPHYLLRWTCLTRFLLSQYINSIL